MKKKVLDYYILIHNPAHHRAMGQGYVFEHVLVAERVLGRMLTEDEDVRHINGNPHDNRPENLEIVSAHSGYRTQSVAESVFYEKPRKLHTKTCVPCKFQRTCWKEIRAPIAKKQKVYLPYICSFQTEGDIYKCSHFWNFIEKREEGT
jgi:hypothetical protein